jgi:hypothetical protein
MALGSALGRRHMLAPTGLQHASMLPPDQLALPTSFRPLALGLQLPMEARPSPLFPSPPMNV